MNKLYVIAAILGLLVLYQSHVYGEEQKLSAPGLNRTMEGIKAAADKGARGVHNLADGVTVNVERFINPAQHQPGQHNIVVSAVQGVGRLARNVTLEAGKFVGTTFGASVRLGRAIPAAALNTFREAATRFGRGRNGSVQKPCSSVDNSTLATNDVDPQAATSPEELKKID